MEPVKDTQEADLDHLTLYCRETCVPLLPWERCFRVTCTCRQHPLEKQACLEGSGGLTAASVQGTPGSLCASVPSCWVRGRPRPNPAPTLYPPLCSACQSRYFLNKEGDFNNLTSAAYHKKTHLLVTGFASGIFHLHELPEFNLIHSLR